MRNRMARGDLTRLTVMASLVAMAPGALGTFTVSAGLAAGLSEGAAGWTLFAAGLSTILARGLYGAWIDRQSTSGIRLLTSVVGVGALTVVGLAFARGMWFAFATIAAYELFLTRLFCSGRYRGGASDLL